MSLCIYTKKEQIPVNTKYILNNDLYFRAGTSLSDDDVTCSLLKKIDKAEYCTSYGFRSRDDIENLSSQYLSTGVKTALNIHMYPDICFDTLECGKNVLEEIIKFDHGQILLDDLQDIPTSTKDCDVIYNGRHYTDTYLLSKDVNDDRSCSDK